LLKAVGLLTQAQLTLTKSLEARQLAQRPDQGLEVFGFPSSGFPY
jgi:hypothetical protein